MTLILKIAAGVLLGNLICGFISMICRLAAQEAEKGESEE